MPSTSDKTRCVERRLNSHSHSVPQTIGILRPVLLDALIFVDERLNNPNQSEGAKHLVIIRRAHPTTCDLIRCYTMEGHTRTLQVLGNSPQTVLNNTRWIINQGYGWKMLKISKLFATRG